MDKSVALAYFPPYGYASILGKLREGGKMKKIAVILPLLFFIVTWNEYAVVWTNDPGELAVYVHPSIRTYEVQISTFTQRLERQIDVDRFTGKRDTFEIPAESYNGIVDFYVGQKGIISPNAFNIRVEEKHE
jgi:hypothetical protein